MAFVGHVIAEPRTVVNAWAFNHRNNVVFVVGSGGGSVLAHRSPFLTLALHEHRISWGQTAYLQGSGMVPLGWLRLTHGASYSYTIGILLDYL
jgi:hypothetical protein